MRNLLRESGLFRKNFKSYLGILGIAWVVIVMIFGVYLYNKEIARKQENYQEHAKKLALLLDNQLEPVHIIYNNLLTASWLNKMMANTHLFDEELDYLRKKEISGELVNWLAMNHLLSHVGVIFPYRDVVLSSTGVFDQDSYSYYLNKQFALGQQVLGEYLEAPWEGQVFREGFWWHDDRHIILFRALEMSDQPKSILLLALNKQAIKQLVTSLCDENVSLVHIYHADQGSWLEVQPTDQPKDYEVSLLSNVMGIRYDIFYAMNLGKLFGELLGRLLIIGLLGVGALSGVAYGLALIQYKPLKGIFERIKHHNINMEKEELGAIEETLDELVEENSKMKVRIERYYDLAKNNLYTQLLKGLFDLEERREELEHLGMSRHEKQKHIILLIDRQATRLGSEKWLKLTLFVEKKLKEEGYDYPVINLLEHLVIICSFQVEEGERSRSLSEEVKEWTAPHFEGTLRISYSLSYEGIIGISKAYQEAVEAMDHISFSQDTLHILFNNEGFGQYYYPTDWEVQLIKNLKQGNLDVVAHILDEIYQENTSRHLEEGEKQRLTNRIMETLIRVLYELKLEEEVVKEKFEEIYQHQSMDEIWEYIYQTTQLIGENVKRRMQEESFNIHEALLAYVKENYVKSELSLKLMSEEFNLSVASISRLFKNAAGVNFHEYLTTLRMEKAKQMLKLEGYEIKKIAKAVGYESDYTFKRAFERNEGIKVREYYLQQVKI